MKNEDLEPYPIERKKLKVERNRRIGVYIKKLLKNTAS